MMTWWQDDRMTGWPNERMSKWRNDLMTGWADDQMNGWWDDWMTWWLVDQMTRWPDDHIIWSPDDRITRWPDDQMTGSPDVRMTWCQDDQMTGWQEASQTIDCMVYFKIYLHGVSLSWSPRLTNLPCTGAWLRYVSICKSPPPTSARHHPALTVLSTYCWFHQRISEISLFVALFQE